MTLKYLAVAIVLMNVVAAREGCDGGDNGADSADWCDESLPPADWYEGELARLQAQARVDEERIEKLEQEAAWLSPVEPVAEALAAAGTIERLGPWLLRGRPEESGCARMSRFFAALNFVAVHGTQDCYKDAWYTLSEVYHMDRDALCAMPGWPLVWRKTAAAQVPGHLLFCGELTLWVNTDATPREERFAASCDDGAEIDCLAPIADHLRQVYGGEQQ